MIKSVGHVIGNYGGFNPTSMDKKGRQAKKKLETFLKEDGIVVKAVREGNDTFQAVLGVKEIEMPEISDRVF